MNFPLPAVGAEEGPGPAGAASCYFLPQGNSTKRQLKRIEAFYYINNTINIINLELHNISLILAALKTKIFDRRLSLVMRQCDYQQIACGSPCSKTI